MTTDYGSRGRRDRAYACFLGPVLLVLFTVVLSRIPMGTGTAGGVGLLLLVPLALLSLVTLLPGIYLAFRCRSDRALVVLAACALAAVIVLFADVGVPGLRHGLGFALAVIAMLIELYWFCLARWRITGAQA